MGALFNTAFFPIFAIVAFIAVVLFIEALYMVWNTYKGPEAKQVEQRLRALSAGTHSSDVTATLKTRLLSEVPLIERLLLAFPIEEVVFVVSPTTLEVDHLPESQPTSACENSCGPDKTQEWAEVSVGRPAWCVPSVGCEAAMAPDNRLTRFAPSTMKGGSQKARPALRTRNDRPSTTRSRLRLRGLPQARSSTPSRGPTRNLPRSAAAARAAAAARPPGS